jgi:hypothetical protein
MSYFFDLISVAFNFPGIKLIFYPFIYAFYYIAQFSFSIATVDVTCEGSKAPLKLLFNVLIIGLIVVIIESDLQVFWTCAFSNTLSKAKRLIVSRYYFRNNRSQAIINGIFAGVLSLFPQARKLIQYAIGTLTLSAFFSTNGHNAITANCDSALSDDINLLLINYTYIDILSTT